MTGEHGKPWVLLVEYAEPGAPHCNRTIVLNGHTYRCARNPHAGGIHDARCEHGDGKAVRW